MKGFLAGIVFTLVAEGALAVTLIVKKQETKGDDDE